MDDQKYYMNLASELLGIIGCSPTPAKLEHMQTCIKLFEADETENFRSKINTGHASYDEYMIF